MATGEQLPLPVKKRGKRVALLGRAGMSSLDVTGHVTSHQSTSSLNGAAVVTTSCTSSHHRSHSASSLHHDHPIPSPSVYKSTISKSSPLIATSRGRNNPPIIRTNYQHQRNDYTSNADNSMNDKIKSTDTSCISSSLPPFSSPLPPLSTAVIRSSPVSITSPHHNASLDSLLPDRTLQVFIGTWNMYEMKELPPCLKDFLLPISQERVADLLAIGTQESTPSRLEWELLLQRTLGPSYILIHHVTFGSLFLYIFLRKELMWFCSDVQCCTFATRPVKAIKTKGSVAIKLMLFGSTFFIITSHFSAGYYNTSLRNIDMLKTHSNLSFNETKSRLAFDTCDFVFWAGDFNYRVELERDKVMKAIRRKDLMYLLLHDQLTSEILAGNVFHHFSEQPISFPPSYKFDLNSDVYDTSELGRVPSWTDRILFRALHKDTIFGCEYDSCKTIKTSDHRPVYGIFRVTIKPCNELYGIPVEPTGYNRGLYTRALKKCKESVTSSSRCEAVDYSDVTLNDTLHPTSTPATINHTTNSSICVIL